MEEEKKLRELQTWLMCTAWKIWQTRKLMDNIYHMLYYSKCSISHAYLPQDQHVNDYSWITYLKNQVLNLQHSVREKKKKKHLNEHSNHSEMSEDQNVFRLFVMDTVCEQWRRAGFFRFCLKHGILCVFFCSTISLDQPDQKYRHIKNATVSRIQCIV